MYKELDSEALFFVDFSSLNNIVWYGLEISISSNPILKIRETWYLRYYFIIWCLQILFYYLVLTIIIIRETANESPLTSTIRHSFKDNLETLKPTLITAAPPHSTGSKASMDARLCCR